MRAAWLTCAAQRRGRREWVSDETEMIVGRIIPPCRQATARTCLRRPGRKFVLPATVDAFDGATNLEAAKAFIERAFGIGDLGDSSQTRRAREEGPRAAGHAYMFVTQKR